MIQEGPPGLNTLHDGCWILTDLVFLSFSLSPENPAFWAGFFFVGS